MEIELMGDTLCLRFDGRTTTVSDEEHVAAFKRLLALPNVAELLLQPMEPYAPGGYDEDYEECPEGFIWANDGVWSAGLDDPNQAPWIVIQRDDAKKEKRYPNDTAAADDNFAEVQYISFEREYRDTDVSELYSESGSEVGVVIARSPTSDAGKHAYMRAVEYLCVLLRNMVGSVEKRTRLSLWLGRHHPQLRKDAGP